jgi:branched-chain amino acid transport system permease protein
MARTDRKSGRVTQAIRAVPGWVWIALALAAAIALPLLEHAGLVQTVWIRVGTRTLVYVLLALGLNLIMGETGLLNLGYVAFFAVGAYATAIVSSPFTGLHWPWYAAVTLSIALAMFAGFLVGLPTLRLRGDYLAVVTLAFGEIVRTTFNNMRSVTNGPGGLPNIQQPTLFGFTIDPISHPEQYYYLVLILVVVVTVLLVNVKNSRIGRAWNALREDEIAARHAGIHPARLKMLAMVISAGIAGLAGSVFAYYQAFINPTYFIFMQSVIVVCMVVLGGMGSIPGAILGAVVLDTLPQIIRAAFSDWLPSVFGPQFMASWPPRLQQFFTEFDRYRMLLFGVIVVVMVIFRPEGLLPDRLWREETHETDPREIERTRQTLFDVDEGHQDLEG